MAKKKLSFNFSKGIISKNSIGRYIFTEISKDNETTYDLESVLENLIDIDDVSIHIGTEEDVSMVENDDE